jgi:hypothetical protein
MRLVRRLVLSCLSHNIYFRSKHIPGKSNLIADSLSRFKFQEAHQLEPFLDRHPNPIPPPFLHI